MSRIQFREGGQLAGRGQGRSGRHFKLQQVPVLPTPRNTDPQTSRAQLPALKACVCRQMHSGPSTPSELLLRALSGWVLPLPPPPPLPTKHH